MAVAARNLGAFLAAQFREAEGTAGGGGRSTDGPVYKNDTGAAAAAAELGFRKTNERAKGAAVFTDGERYITRDRTGHNGGAWKMADSPRELRRRQTRTATVDRNLNPIGQ